MYIHQVYCSFKRYEVGKTKKYSISQLECILIFIIYFSHLTMFRWLFIGVGLALGICATFDRFSAPVATCFFTQPTCPNKN